MKPILICLFLALPQLVLAEAKMPEAKEFFQAEKFVKSYDTPSGKIRTYHTEKTFEQLRKELQLMLGEGWIEAKRPPVKVPEGREDLTDLVKDTAIFKNKKNAKFRVSITLAKSPLKGEVKGKPLLVMTWTNKYLPPAERKSP